MPSEGIGMIKHFILCLNIARNQESVAYFQRNLDPGRNQHRDAMTIVALHPRLCDFKPILDINIRIKNDIPQGLYGKDSFDGSELRCWFRPGSRFR
jgi:hypothetical protein